MRPSCSQVSYGINQCVKDTSLDPTTVTDSFFVWARLPSTPLTEDGTYGKWLVFRNVDELNDTWQEIRKAVEAGELGATAAKCSTARGQTQTGSKRQGVICVYTSETTMDEVGLKLIHVVKNDIRYKTDEATLRRIYAASGHKHITCRTIYWNGGDPSFEKKKQRPKKSSIGSGKSAIREYYKEAL